MLCYFVRVWAQMTSNASRANAEQETIAIPGKIHRESIFAHSIWELEEIVAEASKLSEEERASLASQLLHGLETPVCSVSGEEVRIRMREADADRNPLITFDELVAGLCHRGS